MEGDVKELQSLLRGIFVDVRDFCDKYNIKYCLAFGSALGAERHQGFIPWDDDFDIAMPLSESKKFVELWKQYGNNDKYVLQEINEDSFINHIKIILKDSPYYVDDCVNGNDGLFVDIFPMYKVKKNKLKKAKMWNIVRLVYTRNYPAKNNGKMKYILTWCMLKLVPKCIKKSLLNKANKYIEQFDNLDMKDCYILSMACFDDMRYVFDFDPFEELVEVRFDNVLAKVSSKNKEMLTITYGDYMELPPEEERVWKHSAKLREEKDA